MAELVDARVLGARSERSVGSIPAARTTVRNFKSGEHSRAVN
jgi:hypothetical protein